MTLHTVKSQSNDYDDNNWSHLLILKSDNSIQIHLTVPIPAPVLTPAQTPVYSIHIHILVVAPKFQLQKINFEELKKINSEELKNR